MNVNAITIKKNLGYTLGYFGIFTLAAPLSYFLLGIVLDRILGNPFKFGTHFLWVTGFSVGISGIFFISSAARLLFNKGHGLPLSSLPPSVLVTEGVYSVSRNPVYLGACLLFAGVALLVGSFWSLILSLPLLAAFYFSYARGIEEPVLIDRYGNDYIIYRASVPLIAKIPLFKPLISHFKNLLELLSIHVNRPVIFEYKNHLFFWGYGMWPGTGVLLGLAVMEYILLDQGFPRSITGFLIISLTVCCLLGIRLTWLQVAAFRERSKPVKLKQNVGFISWGVIPGLGITAVVFMLISNYSILIMLDAALTGLLVAHFFGRIGCMYYGCCFGKPCWKPTAGIRYQNPHLKIIREKNLYNVTVLPVQILSGLYGLTGALIILCIWVTNDMAPGVPAAFTAVWYGSFRICEEWLREQRIIWYQFIAPAQISALILFMTGLIALLIIDPLPATTGIGNLSFSVVVINMHFSLLIVSGIITTVLFSYHYRVVGNWR